ncbi:hypothetical protein [Streptomyces sp. ISL-11]|uniref:hypothetical protein n=1 Tax=Streptomyces sp. ISL-11 TaxID=2819174 RepID=UPI001BE711C7|nr:hypothetical protein [Streptomyces sp. ISL-11]MBT2385235.1 hypothetical protein [Streptomyces sp. ISL-11]
MTEDFFGELRQLQRHVESVQQLMSDMQDRIPQHAVGTDAQGAVTVRLAPDGLPASITAATDWQRRQRPEQIGSAVIEAFGSAMSEQMAVWTRAFEDGKWQERAEQLEEMPGSTVTAAPSAAPVGHGLPERDLRYVIPRRLDEVAEDMLSAFAALERLDEVLAEPPQASGGSTGRRVVITVAKGSLVECDIDPAWVAGQSSVGLNRAFAEALDAARAEFTRIEEAGAVGLSHLQLDGLLNEALAIMQNPQRFID